MSVPLYLAENMEGLNRFVDQSPLQTDTPKRLLSSSQKLFQKAKEFDRAGDQEKAYVLYMRYINCASTISKSLDYKNNKAYYDSMLGKDPILALECAEKLDHDLEKRYNQLKEENVLKKQLEVSSNKMSTEEISCQDVDTSLPESVPVAVVDDHFDVTPSHCYEYFQDPEKEILLIDVREASEFEESRIDYSLQINLPSSHLTAGITTCHLLQKLSGEDHELLMRRGTFHSILLIDWSSESIDYGTPIFFVHEALSKWDVHQEAKSVQFLKGGFSEFLMFYPTLCTNTNISVHTPITAASCSLDSINYDTSVFTPASCSLSSGSPGTSVFTPSPSPLPLDVPVVDRTKKPSMNAMPVPKISIVVSDTKEVSNNINDAKNSLSNKSQLPTSYSDPENSPSYLELERKALQTLAVKKERAEKDMTEMLEKKKKVQEDVRLEELKLKEIQDKFTEAQSKMESHQSAAEEKAKKAAEAKYKEEVMIKKTELRRLEEREKKMQEEARNRENSERTIKAKAQEKQRDEQGRLVVNPDLPVDWHKRLDSRTGRYVYVNQNTNQIFQSPPQSLSKSTSANDLTKPHKRLPSHSISQLLENDQLNRPNIDRSNKPKTSTPTRWNMDLSTDKLRNMQPRYGQVVPPATGLRNLANTCYMNSTLQALSHTKLLAQFFLSDAHLPDIRHLDNFGSPIGQVAEEFGILVKALWSGKFTCVAPIDFKYAIGSRNKIFSGCEQQDADELMLFTLDCLHEDMNQGSHSAEIKEDVARPDHEAAAIQWKVHRLLNESVIVELFQGQFRSVKVCLTCRKQSVKFEAFVNLSLQIPSNNRCSLKDCLNHFSREEMLTGSSRWMCPDCKQLRDAIIKIGIWKLPRVLIVHLKRFYYQGLWRHKIKTYIDFPIHQFSMNNWVIGPKSQNVYHLYAVANHYGTFDGGHYTAYCKNPNSQSWNKFDDDIVAPHSIDNVKNDAAYMLFYSSI